MTGMPAVGKGDGDRQADIAEADDRNFTRVIQVFSNKNIARGSLLTRDGSSERSLALNLLG